MNQPDPHSSRRVLKEYVRQSGSLTLRGIFVKDQDDGEIYFIEFVNGMARCIRNEAGDVRVHYNIASCIAEEEDVPSDSWEALGQAYLRDMKSSDELSLCNELEESEEEANETKRERRKSVIEQAAELRREWDKLEKKKHAPNAKSRMKELGPILYELELRAEVEEKRLMERAIAAKNRKAARKLAQSLKPLVRIQRLKLSTCPYCGGGLLDPHVDHIYPLSRGGQSVLSNLVLVCGKCNLKKGEKTLLQFIRQQSFDLKRIETNLRTLNKDF